MLFLLNIINIMRARKIILLPKMEKTLVQVGENIKLARLRRKLSAEQVAERANISRPTLWNIEKGAGSVAMAAYAQVLFVLGLEKDLLKLAGDDPLGRKLQDAELIVKERAPKNSTKNG
jgi:transcriptional regulator with XRE-family HTH domain